MNLRELFKGMIAVAACCTLGFYLPTLLERARGALPQQHPATRVVAYFLRDVEDWQAILIVGSVGGAVLHGVKETWRAIRGGRASDSLDAPLLHWSTGDPWTVRHACEGTLITGSTGSGKTSGSGAAIARAMLRKAWGGLVLTAKRGERELWEAHARACNRLQDLIVIDASCRWRYNPFAAEGRRGDQGGVALNIVHLLSTILEIADPDGGRSSRGDEQYWRKASQQLIRNAVDLLLLARQPLHVTNLYRVVISAAQSREEANSETWRKSSYCYECLVAADECGKLPQQQHDFNVIADYFCIEFAQLSDKTRSVIVSTFTSTIDVLNRGLLRELFGTTTTIEPSVVEQGKIIVFDLPVKEYGMAGKMAQVIFKYAFQRSIERRDVEQSPRPVFLWADEAQHFVASYDHQFLATCRSARTAVCYLTQNLAGLEAALGGEQKGEAEARSLVGHLNTRIFHANSCPHTNSWAADIIGKERIQLASTSVNRTMEVSLPALMGFGPPAQSSHSTSETIDYRIQPADFARLRTGGPANRGVVDAIVFRTGEIFPSTGLPCIEATFQQPKSS